LTSHSIKQEHRIKLTRRCYAQKSHNKVLFKPVSKHGNVNKQGDSRKKETLN